MLRISAKTKQNPKNILSKAAEYFGSGGLGMQVSDGGECFLMFSGGGGHVKVSTSQIDGNAEVEIEAVEWEYQAKEFLQRLTGIK